MSYSVKSVNKASVVKQLAIACFLLAGLLTLQNGYAANQQAAIAMPDKHSAQVAQAVLLKGGNAVDAAVASAFVLAVTYPEAGNLGGGGFMTLYTPNLPTPTKEQTAMHFLDYREKAPKLASEKMYLDEKQQVIPYKSLVGYQASGVPGTVMGLWQAHQRFGSMPWSQLLQPAIQFAQKGFEVSPQLANRSQWFQSWIADKSATPLNFSDYFGALQVGQIFKQPELAKTLQRIAKQGVKEFYFGETAQRLVKQMQQNNGLITLEDLAAYQAQWRQPIIGHWKGREIVSAPPPSSGGIAIVQLLKMKQLLEDKLNQALREAPQNGLSEQAVKTHFYAELEKRVYADRAHFLGDPDFVEVPSQKLIDDDYLAKRAQGVLLDEISESEQIKPGKIELPETTHFSIIDAQGNAVSNTYTLNMPFGSGVVIEGAGFLMNDEMKEVLFETIGDIFEKMAFMFSEVAEDDEMADDLEALRADMSYMGETSGGRIWLAVDAEGNTIAAYRATDDKSRVLIRVK
ncbi:MAG: gamma-glutamyltransferase, partial [Thiomicrorhabdus sp.]|nr:gamma-glutamyltransferase [Thiomicrorhabdus sp.]